MPHKETSEEETKSECICACHDNILKKPYDHDAKCCESMNGDVVPPQTLPEEKEEYEKCADCGYLIILNQCRCYPLHNRPLPKEIGWEEELERIARKTTLCMEENWAIKTKEDIKDLIRKVSSQSRESGRRELERIYKTSDELFEKAIDPYVEKKINESLSAYKKSLREKAIELKAKFPLPSVPPEGLTVFILSDAEKEYLNKWSDYSQVVNYHKGIDDITNLLIPKE